MSNSMLIVRLNAVDLISLAGMFIALCALVALLSGLPWLTISLLYLAVIFDAFDGVLARKYGLQREFGRYLDSFIDVFDYLIAPSLFLYMWGFNAWYESLLLALFMMCGIIRLAVFNQIGNIKDPSHGLGYLGAPVFWSVLALGPLYASSWVIDEAAFTVLLMFLIPAFSLAMLHNKPYYKFKNPAFMFVVLLSASVLFFVVATVHGEVKIAWLQDVWKMMLIAFNSITPVVFAGVIHMFVVAHNRLGFLAIPIHKRLFGANKTWRGVVIMPLATTLGFAILYWFNLNWNDGDIFPFNRYSVVSLGLCIGFAYILAELPNSWVKRRLGAAPGALPESNRTLFFAVDQMDSVFGCFVVYIWIFDYPLETSLAMLVIALPLTYLVKVILYWQGLKKTKR